MREIKLKPVEDTASVVILADVSGSMRGPKIDRLMKELGKLWPEIKARLISFAFEAKWVDGGPHRLPAPGGSTNMRDALLLAGSVWPSEVIDSPPSAARPTHCCRACACGSTRGA